MYVIVYRMTFSFEKKPQNKQKFDCGTQTARGCTVRKLNLASLIHFHFNADSYVIFLSTLIFYLGWCTLGQLFARGYGLIRLFSVDFYFMFANTLGHFFLFLATTEYKEERVCMKLFGGELQVKLMQWFKKLLRKIKVKHKWHCHFKRGNI